MEAAVRATAAAMMMAADAAMAAVVEIEILLFPWLVDLVAALTPLLKLHFPNVAYLFLKIHNILGPTFLLQKKK